MTGFTLAPAAGAVTALTPPAAPAGAVVLAALVGAALALLPRYPAGGSVVMIRAITAAGLGLAASGFGALNLAGTANPQGRLLTLLCISLAGGLGAALTSSLRAAGSPAENPAAKPANSRPARRSPALATCSVMSKLAGVANRVIDPRQAP